jgi:hypothetical protein
LPSRENNQTKTDNTVKNTIMRLFSIAFVFLFTPALAFATPTLSTDSNLATAGYFRLTWSSDDKSASVRQYVLQQADNPDFENPKTLYKGSDMAMVVSGKPDGEYYYRVRTAQPDDPMKSPWSEAVKVTVEHHSLMKAFGFFGAGLVVFAGTLFMIVTGARRTSD